MAAKCAAAPGAKDYCFKTRSGLLLDPTDASGQLSAHPAPGLPWLPTDITLACINEPPRGMGGTNVTVRGGLCLRGARWCVCPSAPTGRSSADGPGAALSRCGFMRLCEGCPLSLASPIAAL